MTDLESICNEYGVDPSDSAARGYLCDLLIQIGKRRFSQTLRNYETDEKTVQVKNFVQGYITRSIPNKRGLLLYGSPGLGKDHLASAVCKSYIALHRQRCVNVSGDDLQTRLHWRNPEQETELEHLKSVFLLWISDIAVAGVRMEDVVRAKLHSLLDYRLDNGLPVIVTVNCQSISGGNGSLDDLIGESSASRICEMCSVGAVVGNDYRKRRVTNA